ncbi:MAG: 50S ribosomal protein L21 [Desulfovibrio sp.]|nr:50S ribosomal protein L21 [Desulfovibrio sp.]MDR2668533.1 50S ribosomal protein L21 [Desulfovibrio sp.]
MYAVIETGGKQFRVEEGTRLRVAALDAEVGSEVVMDKVLLLGGEALAVGKPYVENARVAAEVLEHGRGEKILVFKKRRRHDSRRSKGHRQMYSAVRITSISS